MNNLIPLNFREFLAFISFLIGLAFAFISIGKENREHSLRMTAIMFLILISLFANHAACYFASIFIIATAVTQLDFLQNLAAIIRGSKEYFDYKKVTIPSKVLERSQEKEIEEIEEAIMQDEIPSDSPLNPVIERINNSMVQQNLSGVQFALLVEQYAFKYLENKFKRPLQRYQRVISSNRRIFEFDGIISKDKTDTIIEIKVTRREIYPTKFLKDQILNLIQRIQDYKTISKREVSLRMIIIGQLRISSKNRILKLLPELNDSAGEFEVVIEFLTFDEIGFEFDVNTVPNSGSNLSGVFGGI